MGIGGPLYEENNDFSVSNEGSVSCYNWKESVAFQFAKCPAPPYVWELETTDSTERWHEAETAIS